MDILVQIFVDRQANAARIDFNKATSAGTVHPIRDRAGAVIATITFSAETGELSQLELLNAKAQVPDLMNRTD